MLPLTGARVDAALPSSTSLSSPSPAHLPRGLPRARVHDPALMRASPSDAPASASGDFCRVCRAERRGHANGPRARLAALTTVLVLLGGTCFCTCERNLPRSAHARMSLMQVLKLSGSESLTECNRELCGVQDCCGDKAYVVTAQNIQSSGDSAAAKRKRRFLARSSGVGDYVAFDGRGLSFETDIVPGDEQRDQASRAQ